MKIIKKMVTIILICGIVIVGQNSFVEAKENLIFVSQSAEYDLEKGGMQYFEVCDENGNIAYISVEEMPAVNKVSDGAYLISYTSPGAWTASFKVSITNNRIISVYSPSYIIISGSISSVGLKKISNTKATMSFLYTNTGIIFSTGVQATISNSKLIVSKI